MSAKEHPIVIVKFRKLASQETRCEQLSELLGGELFEAEPLFPGDDEPELGSLFQVTLSSAKGVRDVLDSLEGEREVEYAHEPTARQLTDGE